MNTYQKRVAAGLCWRCGGHNPKKITNVQGKVVKWKLKACPGCAENERGRVLASQNYNRQLFGKPYQAYPY